MCYSADSLSFFHPSFSYLHLWIHSSLLGLLLHSTPLTPLYLLICMWHSHFQLRQSNMIFSPQGQRHITLMGSDRLLCLLSSENNSTYLMSLRILRVLCEYELLKLRKCVTRKVLRAQYAQQRAVLFSHSCKCRVKSEQNLLCRWVIVLRG